MVRDKLSGMASLQAMSEGELEELSSSCRLLHFASNERVIGEGDSSATLYLIIEGEALLSTRDRRGLEREVARLVRGEYMGMFQIMLGQPSMVSAKAITDLLLVAIPGEAANRMLDQSPRLARDLGSSIEARRLAILHAQEGRTALVQ